MIAQMSSITRHFSSMRLEMCAWEEVKMAKKQSRAD
jgi:hypothetical protein